MRWCAVRAQCSVRECRVQLKRKLKSYCDLTTDEELASAMNDPECEMLSVSGVKTELCHL